MCFFKTIEIGKTPALQPCQLNCHQMTQPLFPLFSYYPNSFPSIVQNFYPFMASPAFNNPLQRFLPEICTKIHQNNQNLSQFGEKLTKNEKFLQQADKQILHMIQKTEGRSAPNDGQQVHLGNKKKTLQKNLIFLAKIFGDKNYKYRLRLKAQFPKIIYKERRLTLSVRLVTHQNIVVRNANLLHLRLAACDSNGKWIVEKDESFFMLGRTEVDLYKGEAQFQKVYPSDISRYCPGGKIAIIIYPKPSLLNLTGDVTKGEIVINHQEIEPLCVENILVKAKKRQKY